MVLQYTLQQIPSVRNRTAISQSTDQLIDFLTAAPKNRPSLRTKSHRDGRKMVARRGRARRETQENRTAVLCPRVMGDGREKEILEKSPRDVKKM